MVICGLPLHQGTTESSKNLEKNSSSKWALSISTVLKNALVLSSIRSWSFGSGFFYSYSLERKHQLISNPKVQSSISPLACPIPPKKINVGKNHRVSISSALFTLAYLEGWTYTKRNSYLFNVLLRYCTYFPFMGLPPTKCDVLIWLLIEFRIRFFYSGICV